MSIWRLYSEISGLVKQIVVYKPKWRIYNVICNIYTYAIISYNSPNTMCYLKPYGINNANYNI